MIFLTWMSSKCLPPPPFSNFLFEAKKYRLSLTLTNQYIEQLDESVQALFGNIGSLVSFMVGARDAAILTREFGDLYPPSDLITLQKHQIVLTLSIDGRTSLAFPGTTLPLPKDGNGQRDKIIRVSKERYGRPT